MKKIKKSSSNPFRLADDFLLHSIQFEWMLRFSAETVWRLACASMDYPS